MRFFLCLVSLNGSPVSEPEHQRYESVARKRQLPFSWLKEGSISVLIAGSEPGEPLMARYARHIAVGTVRLDNGDEIAHRVGCSPDGLTDLELALRAVTQDDSRLIPLFEGDFAFVVIPPGRDAVLAACDVFAVKKLYYARRNDVLAIASRGEVLANGEKYDVQHLAELASYCFPSGGRCVYEGVSILPPASIETFQLSRSTLRSYWSAHDCQSTETLTSRPTADLVASCRELLTSAVRTRLTGRSDVWAQLSGGLDSSSVVSLTQQLLGNGAVSNGIAGTVTYVDTHGTGADEREYSDAVVEHTGIVNEQLVDRVLWEQDEEGPPLTDQPSGLYPYYVRDRKLCQRVRDAGGRVLLTGQGGDELFAGNMFFFADWIAHGRIASAAAEMMARAATGRVSFWELAYKNALIPLLPKTVQRRIVREEGQVPPWITRQACRLYDLHARASASGTYAGRIGHKYEDAVAFVVDAIPAKLTTGLIEDFLDVRHPYLHRPLVEFALRLPPELVVRPYARKWVLREAMRGILPEVVRARVGKGAMFGLLSWSAASYHSYLQPLVRDPILAQLGIVDADKFRQAFTRARYERDRPSKTSPDVQYTLALEAWLQVRSGRWSAESGK